MSPNHRLISALSAVAALAALGAAWAVRQRAEPALGLTTSGEIRLAKAENGQVFPLDDFVGAVIEVVPGGILFGEEVIIRMDERERWVGRRYGSTNLRLHRALWSMKQRLAEWRAAGEGAAFPEAALLLIDARVPADVADEIVYTVFEAGFPNIYLAVDDPSPEPEEPSARGCGEAPSLAIELSPGKDADIGARAASARIGANPPEYAVIQNDGPVPWSDVVAAMDALRGEGLDAELSMNDLHDPPPPPSTPPPAEERPPRLVLCHNPIPPSWIPAPIAVLRLSRPLGCQPEEGGLLSRAWRGL